MRFFLLDQITKIDGDKSIQAIKCVTLSEQILHDHFPSLPIYPGSLVIEGLAQLSGFYLELVYNKSENRPPHRAVLAEVQNMKFHIASGPGDRLTYKASIDTLLESTALIHVEAHCESELRVRGQLKFAMIESKIERHNEQRRELWNIWTRILTNAPQLR